MRADCNNHVHQHVGGDTPRELTDLGKKNVAAQGKHKYVAPAATPPLFIPIFYVFFFAGGVPESGGLGGGAGGRLESAGGRFIVCFFFSFGFSFPRIPPPAHLGPPLDYRTFLQTNQHNLPSGYAQWHLARNNWLNKIAKLCILGNIMPHTSAQ